MPEQSFKIGKTWAGPLPQLAVQASWGVPCIEHTRPGAELDPVPDLEDANIIRADGSVEKIYRPGGEIKVNPGDSIQVKEYILHLT